MDVQYRLDPATGRSTGDVHDQVDGLEIHTAGDGSRDFGDQILEAVKSLKGRFGVYRGQTAGIGGVPGPESLKRRCTVPHLSDDDTVGLRPQSIVNEIGHADDLREPPGQCRDMIPGRTLEFGRVLDQDDPIVRKRRFG